VVIDHVRITMGTLFLQVLQRRIRNGARCVKGTQLAYQLPP
jgi:hypothetical protein